jgi:hypothetical protein
LQAANDVGTYYSNPATLYVVDTPVIVTPPATQTVKYDTASPATNTATTGSATASTVLSSTPTPNTGATFSVTVNAVPADNSLTYAWYKSNNCTGSVLGTGSSYNIATPALSDNGSYTVAVTNHSAGAATAGVSTAPVCSSPATLTVENAVTFATLSDETVKLSHAATFSETTAGVPTGTYTWQYLASGGVWQTLTSGAASGSGTTAPQFVTSNAPARADGMQIRLQAVNDVGTYYSNVATLYVVSPPANVQITPSSQTVNQGAGATFTASSSTDTAGEAVSYVWYNSADCSGSSIHTGSTLSLTPLLSDAGSYSVLATNTGTDAGGTGVTNSATCVSASLTVPVGIWSYTTTDGTTQSSMSTARYEAMSLMLPADEVNGYPARFFVAGGQNDNGLLNSVALYTPSAPEQGAWSTGGGATFVNPPHLDGTATLLPNGNVLIAGGSNGEDAQNGNEVFVYTPANGTGSFTDTNIPVLPKALTLQVAALLPNQKVLIAGGSNGWNDVYSNSAYLYTSTAGDASDSIATSNGTLGVARAGSRAVTLADGRILIVGGQDTTGVDKNVDIYDTNATENTPPNSSGVTSPVNYPASFYTISDGGNHTDGDFFAQAKCSATGLNTSGTSLTNSQHPTASLCLGTARLYHTATLLNDGRVLIAGGTDGHSVLSSMEIWDPADNNGAGGFTPLGNMKTPRQNHSAVLLENGKVLIFGGLTTTNPKATIEDGEVIDPSQPSTSPTLSITASLLKTNRAFGSSALLPDGTVLTAGGVQLEAATGSQSRSSSEVFHALEGYSTAPTAEADSNLSVDGTYLLFSADATVSEAGNNILTNYSWTALDGDTFGAYTGKIHTANGTLGSGQGTDYITFTPPANTVGPHAFDAQVTSQYGLSYLIQGSKNFDYQPVPSPDPGDCTLTYTATVNAGSVNDVAPSCPGYTIANVSWGGSGYTVGSASNTQLEYTAPDANTTIHVTATISLYERSGTEYIDDTITVQLLSNSISNFSNPGQQTQGGASWTPSAIATYGTVTYTTSGACTVSGGTIYFNNGTGNCTVYADQAGGGAYAAASQQSVSFNVQAACDAPSGWSLAGNWIGPQSQSGSAFYEYVTGGSGTAPLTVTYSTTLLTDDGGYGGCPGGSIGCEEFTMQADSANPGGPYISATVHNACGDQSTNGYYIN